MRPSSALNNGIVDQTTASLYTTVLFIDDDADDVHFWSHALRVVDSLFLTLRASTASAGIDLCKSKRLDCVVLGLELSGQGFQVLRELISDSVESRIPLVVLSHYSDSYLRERALAHGAQACLLKHRTTPRQLTEAIRTAISSVALVRQESNDRRAPRTRQWVSGL